MKRQCSVLVLAVALIEMTPVRAMAQATVVDSFSEIPSAVFFNVLHGSPCGGHFHDPIQIDVGGGHIVTVTYYSEVVAGNYPLGCINYSQTYVQYHVPNNPADDPGDFIGEYETQLSAYGDLILNFSEPLTGFGSTSILGPFTASSRPNNADRFLMYDGPNGTGNVLADVTTDDIVNLQMRRDFKGAHLVTAQIRSVRYINVFPSFSIDGFAIAVAGEPVGVSWPSSAPGSPPLALGPAVPNPFSGATRLALQLPVASSLRVDVFELSGRRVRTLMHDRVPAGVYPVTWNGRDARGAKLPAGVYLIRASVGTASVMRRVVLTR